MNLDHEKLIVYQRSLDFIEFVHKVINIENFRNNAIDQLDRASTSIPLNIAEGTGKYTGKDKSRFYDIARGSALESAACLDVLAKKGKISEERALEGKKIIFEIVSMLFGLIKSNSDRVYENEFKYKSSSNNEN